ncbi:DUF1761 family protein [Candidatus Dojkabacteria bacterium]|nr:DUF1761 family protein [Candidatus Dojkabacteria bacterium]
MTMPNLLKILVTSSITLLVALVWHSPFVFGKVWLRVSHLLSKKVAEKKESLYRLYLYTYLSGLITTYVLAKFITVLKIQTFIPGMLTGYWMWVGFVAATTLPDYLFEKRPLELFLINVGRDLVSMLLMGGILAVWL